MTNPTSDKRATADNKLIDEAKKKIAERESYYEWWNQQDSISKKIGNYENPKIGILDQDRAKIRDFTARKKVAKEALEKALHPTGLGGVPTDPNPTLVKQALEYFNKMSASLDAANKKFKDDLAIVAKLKAQLAQVQKARKYIDFSKTNQPPAKQTPPGNGPASNQKPEKPKKGPLYKYNAPMTKSAYMGNTIQAQMAGFPSLISGPGNRGDAKYNWQTNTKNGNMAGSKGTVQMSRAFSDLAQNQPASKGAKNVDNQLYGFKFLYNPTTVSMAWGIVEQFSPQFEASGQDKASVMSVGLMKSAITFSLMLNRIDDMNHLDSTMNGDGIIEDAFGSQGTNFGDLKTFYPYDFEWSEIHDIYKRGTMYDLEYLFRTTGGYSASYNSTLNGKTADKGWLNPIPVELHLGDGMRYLVRLSSLDVNHIIFNERMVPTLTTVNLTFTRYYDGPEMLQSPNDAFGITPQSSNEVVK